MAKNEKFLKVWTKFDDSILKESIEGTDNLAEAFKKAAHKLSRTPGACAQRWQKLKTGPTKTPKNKNEQTKKNTVNYYDLVKKMLKKLSQTEKTLIAEQLLDL